MPLYLLIALELKTTKPKTYLFRAWLKKGEDIPKRVVLKHDVTSLKGIPTLIEDSLRKILPDLEQNEGKLTLEFFLPTELLNYDVEEWRPGSDYPIGVDYSVIVRPLERIGKYDRRIRLHRYWKNNKLEDTVTNCAEWLETAAHDCLLPILDKGYVFLGLNFVPDKEFFKELVSSGTPMALWIRQETAKQWQCDLYHQEFCRCRLEELPERLRQQRSISWKQSQRKHTGHLSLLWDDPNRIPLELQETFKLDNLVP